MSSNKQDTVVRAMTNDGAFRFVATRLQKSIGDIAKRQQAKGQNAETLAKLVAGSVLMRETTAPNRRLQLRLSIAKGENAWVADSRPDGKTRGLLRPAEEYNSKGSVLTVNYSLLNGAMHQSIVEVRDSSDMRTILMRYLQESEQIISVIALKTARNDSGIWVAGYVVQLLPEADRTTIEEMTQHLESHLGEAVDWSNPHKTIAELAGDMPYTTLADSEIAFGCTCNKERFIRGIASLGEPDVSDILKEAKPLEVVCDGCGHPYSIAPDEIAAFLESHN